MKNLGFTLVELLVVMSIIGVLSSVVVVAVDPIEQLARGRDAGRKTVASQIAHALEAYNTLNVQSAPTQPWPLVAGNVSQVAPGGEDWLTHLVSIRELQQLPNDVAYGPAMTASCGTNNQRGYCYNVDQTAGNAIVVVRMESRAENITKCNIALNLVSGAWFVWSSAATRSGIFCGNEPTTAEVNNAGITLVQ